MPADSRMIIKAGVWQLNPETDIDGGRHMTDESTSAAEGIRFHYDLPSGFFRLFLRSDNGYSCHYFLTPADTLSQAAVNKLELIARKIDLRSTDRILDIGCGWGSFVFWGCRALRLPRDWDYAKPRINRHTSSTRRTREELPTALTSL